MRTRCWAAAVAFALLALPALAADVTGKWTAAFDTQVGPQKYTFDLKADGEKLTGRAAFERMGQTGEAELTEGKVKGDEVSFVETFDAMGTAVRIEYQGKVTGDEIAFTRKVGEFGTETFVAKRVKP
jgi:opacity protein-like surface antigen